MEKVTIGGKQYEVGALRCKHLKQLSKITSGDNAGSYNDLERFSPYITFAIQQMHPEFTAEMLEEATLQEFLDAWNVVVSCSGIKFVPVGERVPARSTGESSTQDSVSQPAGRILQ